VQGVQGPAHDQHPGAPAEGAAKDAPQERSAASAAAGAASGDAPVGGDVTEEHLVTLLLLAPHLVARLPARLVPEDFRRPECRELFRAMLVFANDRAAGPNGERQEGHETAGGQGRAGDPDDPGDPGHHDPFAATLDVALRAYYDRVRAHARRQPHQTESQVAADVAGVARRIQERNLREQLREAQYLLAEADAEDERVALGRQVGRLAAQLGRVQLERSRSAFYTSPLS
ncbi:MAG: hypothetical protein ACRDJN_15400, partial [Chloroflexota bacterium]